MNDYFDRQYITEDENCFVYFKKILTSASLIPALTAWICWALSNFVTKQHLTETIYKTYS